MLTACLTITNHVIRSNRIRAIQMKEKVGKGRGSAELFLYRPFLSITTTTSLASCMEEHIIIDPLE
jgi:hypothetical protein